MIDTVNEIAITLGEIEEEPLAQIKRLVETLGEDWALNLLEETLALEAEGGMTTKSGKRRRTMGGVFFKLAKSKISREQSKVIFKTKRKKRKKSQTLANIISLEEIQQISSRLLKSAAGKANTIKIRLIGRPGRIVEKDKVALTSMQGNKAPTTLPRGLPTPPDTPTTYLVFIAMKQWKKVKDSININSEDRLVIEGYPAFDRRIGKDGAMTIYAQSVTTTLIQRSKRPA